MVGAVRELETEEEEESKDDATFTNIQKTGVKRQIKKILNNFK
jgi:hypothetical protein